MEALSGVQYPCSKELPDRLLRRRLLRLTARGLGAAHTERARVRTAGSGSAASVDGVMGQHARNVTRRAVMFVDLV
jgi:hypothetical protein